MSFDDETEHEYEAEAGELCPSCGEYLLDGDDGDVIECPICGALTRI